MKRAQMGMGSGKYIGGLILMIAIPVGGGFFLMGLNGLLNFVMSDPIFVGISLISGLLFGFIVRRSVGGVGMGGSWMIFLAIIISAGLIVGYGFLNGNIMFGIMKIMENLIPFLLFYVGGVIGGLIMGSPM